MLAAIVYLGSETIAAAALPGYSYAQDYISDLGIPYPVSRDGTEVLSPLAWLMNTGFVLDGALFGAAALVAGRMRPVGRVGTVFVALAIVRAVGTILVGSVHSGPHEIAAGTHGLHVLGAAMAILGGNAASITAGLWARGQGAHGAYWHTSMLLGLLGLLSLTLLEMNRVLGTVIMPDGLLERGSVYAITLWEILTAYALLTARGRG